MQRHLILYPQVTESPAKSGGSAATTDKSREGTAKYEDLVTN